MSPHPIKDVWPARPSIFAEPPVNKSINGLATDPQVKTLAQSNVSPRSDFLPKAKTKQQNVSAKTLTTSAKATAELTPVLSKFHKIKAALKDGVRGPELAQIVKNTVQSLKTKPELDAFFRLMNGDKSTELLFKTANLKKTLSTREAEQVKKLVLKPFKKFIANTPMSENAAKTLLSLAGALPAVYRVKLMNYLSSRDVQAIEHTVHELDKFLHIHNSYFRYHVTETRNGTLKTAIDIDGSPDAVHSVKQIKKLLDGFERQYVSPLAKAESARKNSLAALEQTGEFIDANFGSIGRMRQGVYRQPEPVEWDGVLPKASNQAPARTLTAAEEKRLKIHKKSKVYDRTRGYWDEYNQILSRWCSDNDVSIMNFIGDPINPAQSSTSGFHSLDGETKYLKENGETVDASIFDVYLHNPAMLGVYQADTQPQAERTWTGAKTGGRTKKTKQNKNAVIVSKTKTSNVTAPEGRIMPKAVKAEISATSDVNPPITQKELNEKWLEVKKLINACDTEGELEIVINRIKKDDNLQEVIGIRSQRQAAFRQLRYDKLKRIQRKSDPGSFVQKAQKQRTLSEIPGKRYHQEMRLATTEAEKITLTDEYINEMNSRTRALSSETLIYRDGNADARAFLKEHKPNSRMYDTSNISKAADARSKEVINKSIPTHSSQTLEEALGLIKPTEKNISAASAKNSDQIMKFEGLTKDIAKIDKVKADELCAKVREQIIGISNQ